MTLPDGSNSRKLRRWWCPAVLWEWERPWWGFHRLDEKWEGAGFPPLGHPYRALYIGPLVLSWVARRSR